MSILGILQEGRAVACAPWTRTVLTTEQWTAMAQALAEQPLDLVALWADTVQVHALFAGPLLVSTRVNDGVYPALSPWRPAAAAFERMIHDLWGHIAAGAEDSRAWLDHGLWEATPPMALRPAAGAGVIEPVFRPGPEALHQVPLGPIRPGIAEPAHWRLHVLGEAVQQAEARFGYAHKGSLVLMRGKSPRIAARFAARLAGDATVAHSIAFARAAEAALGIAAPIRAAMLRAVMAETERAAVHLDTLAGLCGAAGLAPGAALYGRQREQLLIAAEIAFGHRLMMDAVVPGGVATDLAPAGVAAILAAVAGLESMDDAALTERLAGLGRTLAATAAYAPGGVTGRAAGRAGDARLAPGYPPYDQFPPAVTVLDAGDAAARAQMRLAEIAASAALLRSLLAELPAGPINEALPAVSGEGLGVAESVRGEIWHWLRLDSGMIATAFAADAGWRLVPLVELALADGGIGDADLILQSFGVSPSGLDL